MKVVLPVFTNADFEYMNVTIDDANEETFVINKPFAVGYIIIKNTCYYGNVLLVKNGYNGYLGEDCFEQFLKEMLEIEAYVKLFLR